MVDNTGGMGKKARETREKVDKSLQIIEQQILQKTTSKLEALRPQISDQETFDKLLDIVNEATSNNNNLGSLKDNISKLGVAGRDILSKIVSILE